jgi:hypothetical protein
MSDLSQMDQVFHIIMKRFVETGGLLKDRGSFWQPPAP